MVTFRTKKEIIRKLVEVSKSFIQTYRIGTELLSIIKYYVNIISCYHDYHIVIIATLARLHVA